MSKYILLFAFLFSGIASAIEQQEHNQWCWAACIQTCMAQANHPITQSKVVERLKGWVANEPASIQDVVAVLRSYGFKAWRAGRPGTPGELYRSLIKGWKLIAFVKPTYGPVGHFIVLEGIEPQYGGIFVSDPWTAKTEPVYKEVLYKGWRWVDSIVVGTPDF